MSSLKTILVTGATGKQGGAVLKFLVAANTPTPQFAIIALTRTLTSPKAQSLAALPNVTILQGDLNDCPAIFAQITTPIYGVFSVQTPEKPAVEEAQGKALVDAAIAANVQHFVYASVERGGDVKSDTTPTHIPHFISKHNIEKHLLEKTASGNMSWTIIRPVGFMENFTPDIPGKGMATMWLLNGPTSRLQLVSAIDIGKLTALAFQKPDEFKGRSISLAGDDLTWNEMNEVFKKVTGKNVPTMYQFLGKLLRWMLWEQLGIMFVWFGTDGFGADVEGCRKLVPGMLGLEEWLRTESAYKDVAGK